MWVRSVVVVSTLRRLIAVVVPYILIFMLVDVVHSFRSSSALSSPTFGSRIRAIRTIQQRKQDFKHQNDMLFLTRTAFVPKNSQPQQLLRSSNDDRMDVSMANSDGTNIDDDTTTFKVVVIGGGWAGFSVADALSSSYNNNNDSDRKIEVTIVDASNVMGGLASGWNATSPSTSSSYQDVPKPKQRSVEVGIHGFWREYKNTFHVMEKSIGLNLDDVLTPYISSALYSVSGRVAIAPVLGDKEDESNNDDNIMNPSRLLSPDSIIPMLNILRSVFLGNDDNFFTSFNAKKLLKDSGIAKLLPSPLDIALLSDFSSSILSWTDRISGLGLLGVWADFDPNDPESWYRYDTISADNVLRTAGISSNLYNELVVPMLHVLPMTTPYDCSAAAAISCFHVFALQSSGAFDVRWCRGTISSKIFEPWKEKLRSNNVQFLTGSKVTMIEECNNTTTDGEKSSDLGGGNGLFRVTINNESRINCNAIVLAVGISAAQKLVQSCPPLANCYVTNKWNKLKGVTCVAVRLFFAPGSESDISTAMKDSPVAVCGPKMGQIPQLAETGFCIYDLQRLQDEYKDSATDGKMAAAFEVDYFRADSFVNFTDEEIVSLTLRAVASALQLEKALDRQSVVETSVVRARNAVSHFAVNSATNIGMDGVRLRKDKKGLYACGDWIDRAGHSSWSTEKSVVTGRQAAAAIAKDFQLTSQLDVSIIPPPSDTPQLSALRQVAKLARSINPPRQRRGGKRNAGSL